MLGHEFMRNAMLAGTFVALACGRAGIAAGAFLLLALGLTQTWFPWSYWQLASGHASPSTYGRRVRRAGGGAVGRRPRRESRRRR